MDFFYTKIENSGPATARIGIKGHAPLSQFLNSSFILQFRTQRNMIFPLDNRHFITDSIYYYLERYSSFSYIQTQKGYSLLHMCRPFSSTDIKRCCLEINDSFPK